MWATILKITKMTSIILPMERHLLQWCLITSDMAYLAKQSMRTLWYQIYSVYIQILYRTHYNPLSHPISYQKEFLNKLIHQLKISHLKLLKDIETNKASLKSAEEIDKKNISITQDFCRTWTHPYISELDDNNKLTININYKETEDTIYQECLEQAETLIQCDHPYHTSNH